jgi:hypothetical protein
MASRVQRQSHAPEDRVAEKNKTANERNNMKLKTHIHKTAVATLGILSLTPALVFAGNTAKPSEERGVIKSVDMTAHTLVVTEHKKNSEQTFQWNDQTKFTERHKSASASALKQGERVDLTYTPGGSTPVLKSVHIAPANTKKPSASNY